MKLLLQASAGLIVWAVGFSLIYALHGLGCAGGWTATPLFGSTLLRVSLLAAWALFLLAAAAVVVWSRRLSASDQMERFRTKLAGVSALAGLFSLVVTGAPIVFSTACI